VLAIGQACDLTAHLGRGRLLQLSHRHRHRLGTLLGDEHLEQPNAASVGGHHRLELRNVVVGIPRGVARSGQPLAKPRLVEAPVAHHLEGFDQDSFLFE
jgi:hypothetical protein